MISCYNLLTTNIINILKNNPFSCLSRLYPYTYNCISLSALIAHLLIASQKINTSMQTILAVIIASIIV